MNRGTFSSIYRGVILRPKVIQKLNTITTLKYNNTVCLSVRVGKPGKCSYVQTIDITTARGGGKILKLERRTN